MEKSEALLFLGISDGEELNDAYDTKVFEWKNFFVNRFPIPSLFGKKIKQLEKLEKAYTVLGGESKEVNDPKVELVFADNFKEAFQQFSERRAFLKAQLFQAESAVDIAKVVQVLIDLTLAYAQVWNNEKLSTAGVVVSKEPDPMDLLVAIPEAEKIGVHNISKIDALPENHLVVNEAKRLSLLIKMNKEKQ
ncbi:hypothetical protein N9355_03110 [Crocinitomicaceae bacterium]|nr:hypothetical protein [Crocinitomicaceae bacterium]